MTALFGRKRLAPRHSSTPPLQSVKLRAIHSVFEERNIRSFADLGGVWAVAAGYTFHCLHRFSVDRALLVDTGVTDSVRRRAEHEAPLRILDGNFTDPTVAERVGEVDAVFLFDVLLHQVRPDWDEVLTMYASRTGFFVIVNPQYVAGPQTVRLPDLTKDQYDRLVPASPVHDEAWAQPHAIHPKYKRPYRDIHEIWQWGIVDADLDSACRDLGFQLVYYENAGMWQGLPAFENHAFVYERVPGGRREGSPRFIRSIGQTQE